MARSTDRAATAVVVALAAASVLLELASFRRGLDFWDGAWTLVLAEHPDVALDREVVTVQYLLHPLWMLVGRDVALLEALGFGALLVTAAAAALSASSLLRAEGVEVTRRRSLLTTAVVAASTATAYVGVGRVPGYRVVALLGALWLVVALARVWTTRRPAWGALAGAAGVLAFTGKPTTAAALALVFLAALCAGRRQVLPTMACALLGAVGAGAAVLVVAGLSPAGLGRHLTGGLAVDEAAGTHSSWLAMLGVAPVPARVLLVLGPLVLLPLLLALHDVRSSAVPRWPTGLATVVGVVVPMGVAVLGAWLLSAQGYGAQSSQLLLPWGLGALALVALAAPRAPRPPVLLAGVLVLLPWTVAVGTNTGFSATMTQAAACWALAVTTGLALVRARWPRTDRLAVPVALTLVTTTVLTQVLWLGDSVEGRGVLGARSTTPVLGGTLGLDRDTTTLVRGLSEASRREHLAGRPSVDLTGFGAGYQLILGTRPLGRASFFGTFRGADRAAALTLGQEDRRDLCSAVVLVVEQDNPLGVVPAASAVGLDPARGYREVHRFHPSHGEPVVTALTVRVLVPEPAADGACGGVSPGGG